jgi:hypothetical protein
MFSFINFLQSILQKLKKNKGVWFTVLTVASVMGVLISISLINIMTTDVSHKTYMQVHRVDTMQLENILDTKYDSLLAIGGVVSMHPDIIQNIKSQSDKSINDLLKILSNSINTKLNLDPIKIKYYATDYEATLSENNSYADLVISSNTSVSGLAINTDGVRIVAIVPIQDGNKTVGAIEVSQDISTIREEFEKIGKEFAFLVNKTQLVFMDLGTKQGNMQDINDKYKIFFHDYSSPFFTNIREIDLEKLQREKYFIDLKYFTTYEEAININGKPIGMFIIGESSEEANSFVNITKNLISSVTTVALGLVISLILFMF